MLTRNLLLLSLLSLTLLLGAADARRKSKFRADAAADEAAPESKDKRTGKLFSLFNVVTFNNGACRSNSAIAAGGGTTSTNRNGTCFTNQECSDRGGAASGSCAAGFGVCCVFLVSATGSTISENCTYVRNTGFPTGTTATNALQFTVQKTSNNVCRLRLDFESFNIQGTGNSNEFVMAATDEGGTCLDTFTVTSQTNQRVPVICGQNTGQHIYVEIGRQPADTATLSFAFTGTATRTFEIKVSQIPCFNACTKDFLPPEGCLQYHTGVTGRLTSFNFIPTATETHLRNQDYSICIRQEDGFCCIQYNVCPDANSFSLDPLAAIMMAGVDTLCSTDFIRIPEAQGSCNSMVMLPTHTRFCGPILNFIPTNTVNAPICDCTKPFAVDIFTNALSDNAVGVGGIANSKASRGVCLEYMQIPC